jgi:hypothetical protein
MEYISNLTAEEVNNNIHCLIRHIATDDYIKNVECDEQYKSNADRMLDNYFILINKRAYANINIDDLLNRKKRAYKINLQKKLNAQKLRCYKCIIHNLEVADIIRDIKELLKYIQSDQYFISIGEGPYTSEQAPEVLLLYFDRLENMDPVPIQYNKLKNKSLKIFNKNSRRNEILNRSKLNIIRFLIINKNDVLYLSELYLKFTKDIKTYEDLKKNLMEHLQYAKDIKITDGDREINEDNPRLIITDDKLYNLEIIK